MKIYKTQADLLKDVVDGKLKVDVSLTFEFDLQSDISITARNITARSITAGDITARNINAGDITARSITARNITAGDIFAGDILAGDITADYITARNITAGDINAEDITADYITAMDISYYAFCNVYKVIKCLSIKSRREIANKPVCLNGKIEIIKKNGEK